MSKDRCMKTTESKGILGQSNYSTCYNPVKYRIKYKGLVRGKIIEEEVCGVHFRSIENTLNKFDRNFIEKEEI